MVDLATAFPSEFLKHQDIGMAEFTVTIETALIKDMGDGQEKPVLYFKEAQKGLVLNRTNSDELFALFGTHDTDQMRGRQVILFTVATQTPQGQATRGIRLRGIPAAAAPNSPLGGTVAVQAPLTPPTNPAAPGGPLPASVEDDPIPF